jgi:UMF1 family MFS transporter
MLQKGNKKLLNAWAFYDWANSVYTLTVTSSIFPIFYSALFLSEIKSVEAFGFEFKSTALITIVTAFTFMVVAILSPILSGIADYIGNKKNFMKFFCYVGAIGCIDLYWFDLEQIHLGLLFYFMGLIGYWGSLVFYNSYLPDIAHKDQQDNLSAKGFALGYIGSVLLLVINLIMVMSQEDGADKIQMMRYSFITVGIWWAGFSQYTFYVLPKGVSSGHKVTKDIILNGFKELNGVWKQLKENERLKRYLHAFFVFSMAVQTIMLVAVYFGEEEITWADNDAKTMGLIVSILIIQIVAVIGAYITSYCSSKFGNIKTLIAVNIIWMLLCVYAYFMVSPIQFYIAASMVGMVMGGIQSLARSTYSKFLPETEDTASFFSFYDVAEKIGIVIGMGIFGFIDQVTGSMRNSILILVFFFFIGIILLLRVPRKQTNKKAISQ